MTTYLPKIIWKNSGWKPVAEQTNAALIVLNAVPAAGTEKDIIQSEISYSEAVLKDPLPACISA